MSSQLDCQVDQQTANWSHVWQADKVQLHELIDTIMDNGFDRNIRSDLIGYLSKSGCKPSSGKPIKQILNPVQFHDPIKSDTKASEDSSESSKISWADMTDDDSEKSDTAAIPAAPKELGMGKSKPFSWTKIVKSPDCDRAVTASNIKHVTDADYKKFHTMTPTKPEKKISSDDMKSLLAKQKAEEEDVAAGFVLVSKSRISKSRSSKDQASQSWKFTSINKHPEKLKITTSAKWFFFPDKPILSESDDWNLWDYTTDDQGLAVPIGWYQLSPTQFKIKWSSSFVHTRHEDGSWSHEEETYDSGRAKRDRVSAEYLRWVLTPVAMRDRTPPAE